jgi:hypothetical protein
VPPYTSVPLSKGVLAGTEPIAETVLAPLSDEVNLRLGMRATALDIDARLVHTTGPVRYDGLVIATGGRARRVGRPDQDERVLRSHLDCARLRANRDERRWQDPERFDIHRDNMRQLAFGYGIHSCIGQGLARLEGHAMLAALARRVERFEIDGSAPFINNLVHGLDSLPVTITAPRLRCLGLLAPKRIRPPGLPCRQASPRLADQPPCSLPGWSALVLQHGAEGAAADFQEYRIVFGVGQEHDREVQCPASGPRP